MDTRQRAREAACSGPAVLAAMGEGGPSRGRGEHSSAETGGEGGRAREALAAFRFLQSPTQWVEQFCAREIWGEWSEVVERSISKLHREETRGS